MGVIPIKGLNKEQTQIILFFLCLESYSLTSRNFWASEIYFFHSLDQMRLVAEMCPKIAKMLFMFQDR
jgi:hypothetical protein